MEYQRLKPIRFTAEEVQAIKNNQKSVKRLVIKPQPGELDWGGSFVYYERIPCDTGWYGRQLQLPYVPEDILYVQETWAQPAQHIFWYKADSPVQNILWRPSIHMPKEAARIFLRVTNVRVERLQEIDNAGARAEGCDGRTEGPQDGALTDWQRQYDFSIEKFQTVWDSAIKKADRDKYGWNANPWVYVIGFEQISKEEMKKHENID